MIGFVYFDCIKCVKRQLKVPNSIINKIKTSLWARKGPRNSIKSEFCRLIHDERGTRTKQKRETSWRAPQIGTQNEPTNQIKRFTCKCKRNLLSGLHFVQHTTSTDRSGIRFQPLLGFLRKRKNGKSFYGCRQVSQLEWYMCVCVFRFVSFRVK